MASRARKLKSKQDKAFNAVEENPNLLDLLEIATSPARQSIFIVALLEILPTAFAQFNQNPEGLFTLFTSWFSSYHQSITHFPCIHAALKHREHYIWDNRFKKRQFIKDIGLDWTADIKSDFIAKVNSLFNVVGNGLISFLDQDDLCSEVENPLSSQIQLDRRIGKH
jgi:glutathionylspermidine synthase